MNKLQAVLEQHWPGLNFIRPDLPFHDPRSPADVLVKELLRIEIPEGSRPVGLGLGGLVAARLQELGRQDLQVIAIGSPTWADEVTLESGAERRLAFYSSQDPVIWSRITNWPQLASFSQDLDWLDQQKISISNTSPGCSTGNVAGTLPEADSQTFENPPRQKQERDEMV